MEEKQRYTLQKTERLKSRKIIERLFKNGRSFSVFPFRVLYEFKERLPETEQIPIVQPCLQAGFSVGTKYFKKAVDRNRIRRQMRESYRLQKTGLDIKMKGSGKSLVFFIIYTGNEKPGYKTVFEKTGQILERFIKMTDENPVANT